jgi:hypothetical protein
MNSLQATKKTTNKKYTRILAEVNIAQPIILIRPPNSGDTTKNYTNKILIYTKDDPNTSARNHDPHWISPCPINGAADETSIPSTLQTTFGINLSIH